MTIALRFPDAPERVARLPADRRGYPVPWFVAWRDGEPDFRTVSAVRLSQAWADERCWICGERLGSFRAWVIGTMCAVERACPEPPSHLECAEFGVRACPYLANPRMRRVEPEAQAPGQVAVGSTVQMNTGASVLWITKGRGGRPFRSGGGLLFALDEPARISWWAHGRPACAEEVRRALDLGLPLLRATAQAEGVNAMADLDRRLAWVERRMPAPPP
jgi:hypothetical protein